MSNNDTKVKTATNGNMSIEYDIRMGAAGAQGPTAAPEPRTVALADGQNIRRGLRLEGCPLAPVVAGERRDHSRDRPEIDKDLYRAPQDALWRPHRYAGSTLSAYA